MKAFLTAIQEVYGLFVEDGSYAAAIIVWLAAAAFLFPHIPGVTWRGPMLFAGMAAIMLESVVRAAKARK